MSPALSFGSLLAGAAAAVAGLRWATSALKSDRHVRSNFRGRPVIATAGLALIAPMLAGAMAALLLLEDARVAVAMAAASLAVAVLGLVDDVYGSRQAGGLIGHSRALLRGTFTTGMAKALGGAAIGLASSFALGWRGPWLLVAGAAVALSANFANLLDVRPGRVVKVWWLCAVALVWQHVDGGGGVVLVAVAGGLAVWFVPEMQEKVMLGDTGAGLLGALIGVAVVASVGALGAAVISAILLVLTLLSEFVSFSRVVNSVRPLRYLDRLGGLKQDDG